MCIKAQAGTASFTELVLYTLLYRTKLVLSLHHSKNKTKKLNKCTKQHHPFPQYYRNATIHTLYYAINTHITKHTLFAHVIRRISILFLFTKYGNKTTFSFHPQKK